MELKDFIAQSLTDIAAGLKTANTNLKEAQTGEKTNSYFLSPGHRRTAGTGVHFDVAVITRSETGKGGKVSAKITIVEAGLEGQQNQTKELASRISFTVMVGQYIA